MCLVVLAIGQSTLYPLILAANRDEFHGRPTQKADWWPDKPNVIGGRDLQAGGTWLALHRNGRFATVTNYRDAEPVSAKFRSRGHLVTEFLESDQSPLDYLEAIDGPSYAGFNLIVGDARNVAYLSNRGAELCELPAGLYGLSNALLDGPWDKVERSKRGLATLLDHDTVNETTLLRLLDDRKLGPIEEVEAERLGFAKAHAITAPFIVTPEYGTRCSTVVIADRSGRWRMTERRFDRQGVSSGESHFTFATHG
ncbi:MAG: NRDE family protein [Gammaproteobacteria bacterium]|nr:NRDE family protein [Gammaproteobacteria bacterium]